MHNFSEKNIMRISYDYLKRQFLDLVSILYDFKTNICTWDVSAQVKISLRHLIIFWDYHSYTTESARISFLASLDSFLASKLGRRRRWSVVPSFGR